jgi:hypothetical protein
VDRLSVIVICSSPSVEKWWRHFTSAFVEHEVLWPASDPRSHLEIADALTNLEAASPILVLSEHFTLARDALLVDLLRRRGRDVVGTGPEDSLFELDKIAAKRRFETRGVSTPRWGTVPLNCRRQLRKPSQSTQGMGIAWHSAATHGDPAENVHYYYEEFLSGTEFSVNVVISIDGAVHFLPPVWKGETDESLVPPYRRLRLSGLQRPRQFADNALIAVADKVVHLFAGPCILEVECALVDGQPLVLEVNPRISGTTRMAALAGGVKFLDLCFPGHEAGLKRAVCCVGEMPLLSRGDDAALSPKMFATSRMTVVADGLGGLVSQFEVAQATGWKTDAGARRCLESLAYVQNPDQLRFA